MHGKLKLKQSIIYILYYYLSVVGDVLLMAYTFGSGTDFNFDFDSLTAKLNKVRISSDYNYE